MKPGRRLSEAQIALMLLTRFPAGRIRGEPPALSDASWAYPLAGLPVGLVGWAMVAILPAEVPFLAAVVALGAMALATGGLHHDGLADFADGLGGRDRDHRLEIMRDSRIGSYGVVALIFIVTLGASAIAGLPPEAPFAGIFLLSAVASRLAMLVALDLLPPARNDGLGQSASAARTKAGWAAGGVATGILAVLTGPLALAILSGIALTAVVVMRTAHRNLGGQTGDVLGAVQLASETAGFAAAAFASVVLAEVF